ncbi:MAG: AMP-binding protein [Alphaproteobacteria bacterium]
MDLSHWIARHADFSPNKTALHFEGENLSYQGLHGRICGAAWVLRSQYGVSAGDRVAFLGANCPDLLVLLFAAARIGAMVLPLNWRLAAAEHGYILKHADPALLLCTAEFRSEADAAVARLDGIMPVVEIAAGWDSAEDRDEVPSLDEAGTPLLMVYTSGTTGLPKGVVLTQDALLWNAINATHMHDLTSADHVLTALPMFHVGGLNIQTLPALHAGATVTLHRRFEPGLVLDALEKDQPSLTVLVPATIQALIDHRRWAATDISSLRLVATGSSIVPLPLIEALHRRDVPTILVYGSTETAPIAAYLRREDAARKIGTTGKAALHCDLRVVDEDGGDVATGVPGEILVKGASVMKEYWRDEVASAGALRGGWYHTGDVGHFDDEGYLVFDERKTDLIVSGGENIYPAELELVLQEASFVAAAAVVGQPDRRWGEVPVAVIELRPGTSPSKADVLALFGDRLARFKHPRDVLFVEQLPRSALGKILKFKLRELLEGSPL